MSVGVPTDEHGVAAVRGSGPDLRWFAVGASGDPDARVAGAEAAARALAGDDPKLLVVFCADSYDLDELLAGIAANAPDVPLIGCSTAGEISSGGPDDSSVVVTALGGPGFTIATAAAEAVSSRLRAAGAELAQTLDAAVSSDAGSRAFLILTDGLCGDQDEIVGGVYGVVGASVPLVGGCAGDNLKMSKTFQLHDGRVLENAVVGAAIASAGAIGIGVQHGCQRVGEPVLVTSSRETRVYKLDDEPALDLYLRHLDAPAEAYNDPAAFTRFAVTHPLGLDRRSGIELRAVVGADFEDRSLACVARVPQGGLASLMEGDAASVMAATDTACDAALHALPAPPVGLLVFDCMRSLRRPSASSSSTASHVAASSGRKGFSKRSIVSPRAATARPSRASTPTARSRGPRG